MRHRHLDFDIGEAELTSLPPSDTSPTPTAILSTSLGTYQLLWRVVGFTFMHQESMLKLRTIVLDSYLDFTGCSRIPRLQGLPNCEHDLAYPFTLEHSCDSTRNPDGHRLDILATNAMLSSRAITLRKRLGEYTNSEPDWGVDSARAGPCKWCGGVVAKGACSRGGVQGFYAGIEGVILHSISSRGKNGASHRKNFDTPPLGGNCRETCEC
ncbi:MAG: RepB family DNA primase [Acidobacteriia bacterium]|nr:RepB family DNA primase [Terriglobia bacterium]